MALQKGNYSEPHAQNRIFDALLLLMWLLRPINCVKYACEQAYSDSICMALNQCHLVSDKVGNFHGNKALVTFL